MPQTNFNIYFHLSKTFTKMTHHLVFSGTLTSPTASYSFPCEPFLPQDCQVPAILSPPCLSTSTSSIAYSPSCRWLYPMNLLKAGKEKHMVMSNCSLFLSNGVLASHVNFCTITKRWRYRVFSTH